MKSKGHETVAVVVVVFTNAQVSEEKGGGGTIQLPSVCIRGNVFNETYGLCVSLLLRSSSSSSLQLVKIDDGQAGKVVQRRGEANLVLYVVSLPYDIVPVRYNRV